MNSGTPHNCLLLGGGGHARMLIEILRQKSDCRVIGILDANRDLWKRTVLDIPVLGDDDLLPSLVGQGITHFVVAVGSTSSTKRRQHLFERSVGCGLVPLDVTHPTAIVSPSSLAGPGCQLFPYAVVNAGARLGRNVLVNTGAIVEHDCELGDHVHVASGAVLCGGVRVGTGTHVGAGSVVRQGIRVGHHAVIGAGAVVINDVPDQTIVAGVPARPLPGSAHFRTGTDLTIDCES